MQPASATVWAPGTVGNVGPGFDVLGLGVDGVGDAVRVDLHAGPPEVVGVTGRDAALVPVDPERNVAVISARAWLRRAGDLREPRVTIVKGLPLAGGMGGSAASSVGGALAAALAAGAHPSPTDVMEAALAGEGAVAGRHLDNIAPCVLGGLALVLGVDPVDVVPVPVAAPWWVALATPAVRVETRAARGILPDSWGWPAWVGQMARTAALVHAFSTGDAMLVKRALVDDFAEPRRAGLIPRFHEVKSAALAAGALGCSISGSGPTLFALCADERTARAAAASMAAAFRDVPSTTHAGPVARRGAHRA